jgi:hypothetical protein
MPTGGGSSGGGGLGGGTGGNAFGPGFGTGGAGPSSGTTAQTEPNASFAQATAPAGRGIPSAQTNASGGVSSQAGDKPRKGAAAYKGAFTWEAAKKAGGDLGEAVDPISRTGT